jgi:hypothetical protein
LALLVKLLSLLVKQKRRKGRRRARRACSSARLARKRHRAQLRWLRRFYAFLRSVKRRSSAADSSDDSEEWGPSSSVSQRQASNKPETGSAPAEPAAEELAERVSLPADVPELEELPYAIDDLSNSGWNHFCKFEDMTFLGQNDDVVSSPAGVSRWGWADSPRRVAGVVRRAVRPAEKVGGGYGNGDMTEGSHRRGGVIDGASAAGPGAEGDVTPGEGTESNQRQSLATDKVSGKLATVGNQGFGSVGMTEGSPRKGMVADDHHQEAGLADRSGPTLAMAGDALCPVSSAHSWEGRPPLTKEEGRSAPLPSRSAGNLRPYLLVDIDLYNCSIANYSIAFRLYWNALKLAVLQSNIFDSGSGEWICGEKGLLRCSLLSDAKVFIIPILPSYHLMEFRIRDPPSVRGIGSPGWRHLRRWGRLWVWGASRPRRGQGYFFRENAGERSTGGGPSL